MLNIPAIEDAISFASISPFRHCVIDNFFESGLADKLEKEFIEYSDPRWLYYNNPVENKKTLNDWNVFPALTYSVFSMLCSPEAAQLFSGLVDVPLYPDYGLHGGGWHIHADGGNLNPHLDYFTHPKLGLRRKVNLIVYLTSPETGNLGFWENGDRPGRLVKEIKPKKNRAVIFETENSWHGLTEKMQCNKGIYRKSLAMYYLTHNGGDGRKRALFYPRDAQRGDLEILEFCKKRNQL